MRRMQVFVLQLRSQPFQGSIPARIIRCAIYAVWHTIAIAVTIDAIGNAIAVTVAHWPGVWLAAIPAAAFVDPAAIAFRPIARMVVVANAFTFPMAAGP